VRASAVTPATPATRPGLIRDQDPALAARADAAERGAFHGHQRPEAAGGMIPGPALALGHRREPDVGPLPTIRAHLHGVGMPRGVLQYVDAGTATAMSPDRDLHLRAIGAIVVGGNQVRARRVLVKNALGLARKVLLAHEDLIRRDHLRTHHRHAGHLLLGVAGTLAAPNLPGLLRLNGVVTSEMDLRVTDQPQMGRGTNLKRICRIFIQAGERRWQEAVAVTDLVEGFRLVTSCSCRTRQSLPEQSIGAARLSTRVSAAYELGTGKVRGGFWWAAFKHECSIMYNS